MRPHNKKSQAMRFYVLLGIGLSAVFHFAQAQQVTVNFTGSVTAANCVVQSGTTLAVPLGAVKVHEFTVAQTEVPGSTKSVAVQLTNCAPNSDVTFTLGGTEDASGSGRLAIATGANMATGIAIAPLFKDTQGTSFWKGVTGGISVRTDANGSATFEIGGTLVKRATNIPVTPGQVTASMTMTMNTN